MVGKGAEKKQKQANTDSTMLKSRQLAVDLCPQASQSVGAQSETTTARILKMFEFLTNIKERMMLQ